MSTLGWLVDPVGRDAFVADTWEKRPFHVSRQDAQRFREVFSIGALEQILHGSKPKPPDVRVVREQQDLLPDRYVLPEGDLNLNQLYKALDEGYTIIVNGLERFWSPLTRLCRDLQRELSHKVVANCYLTPAGTRALAPHFDTHDVFVLQIEGDKRWFVHPAAVESPLLKTFQPVFDVASLPPALESPRLEAGDTMYMPRGFVHRAEATTTASLHVTLGIYPAQWADLLSSALNAVAVRDVRLRRALPLGYLEDRDVWPELQRGLTELMGEVAREASGLEAIAGLDDALVRLSSPAPDGHFSEVVARRSIELDTRVERRPGLRCRYIESAGKASLQFPGNLVDGPGTWAEGLRFVANARGPFTPRELPDVLEPERRVELVQRLVRGGLLRRA